MRFTDGSVLGTYTTTTSSGVTSGKWGAGDIYKASLNKLWPHVPVFTNTTGVTAYTDTLTNLNYQTSINYTPTSYGAAGLPTSVSITSAGLITGTAASSGLYVTTLSAINLNGAGYSTFTINVSAGIIQYLTATGGTTTTGNGYSQWAFTSSGTWTVTTPGIAYYAIVGGGGGGGASVGGGGGAGGVITGILSASAGTYSITIGSGGTAGQSASSPGTNGSISSFAGLSALGGGKGGDSGGGNVNPYNGASGGGGQDNNGGAVSGAYGVAGQGWAGGNNSVTSAYGSGGGGGAGGAAANASAGVSTAGGIGVSIYLPASGVSTYVGGGGGGGGGSTSITAGAGGLGGGGAGQGYTAGTAGTANTGGGGGAGAYYNPTGIYAGGAGGSGVVYIWAPSVSTTKTPYVNYLVVAGGGGASPSFSVYEVGGGGGAGGLVTGITNVSAGVTYNITVGAAGAGGLNSTTAPTNGGNSGLSATSVLVLTALGGGVGGDWNFAATTGGSGGGGSSSSSNTAGAAGTTGQGNSGGSYGSGHSGNTSACAAGGGGYYQPGSSATANGNGSNGGDGGTFGIANGTGLNWSSYIDSGSSNYYYIASNSGTALQSNNFTIEFWVYFNDPSSNAIRAVYTNYTAFGANSILIGKHTNNSGYMTAWFGNYSNVGPLLAESSYPPSNAWTHYALVRNGNTFTLYRNGVSSVTGSYSGSVTSTSNPCYIGQGGDAIGTYNYCLNGYMSNFRIVNGTAVYTSNFTPPTASLTAITNTALLTLQSPVVIDNSSNNYSITAYNTVRTVSQNPFGISYAGGGGGGGYNSSGYGGMGGGGAGAAAATAGNNATANTGGGGGGAGTSQTNTYAGGNGGSGIVVLSYPSSYPVAASTTGSPSLSTINGNNIYKFNATGSITF